MYIVVLIVIVIVNVNVVVIVIIIVVVVVVVNVIVFVIVIVIVIVIGAPVGWLDNLCCFVCWVTNCTKKKKTWRKAGLQHIVGMWAGRPSIGVSH